MDFKVAIQVHPVSCQLTDSSGYEACLFGSESCFHFKKEEHAHTATWSHIPKIDLHTHTHMHNSSQMSAVTVNTNTWCKKILERHWCKCYPCSQRWQGLEKLKEGGRITLRRNVWIVFHCSNIPVIEGRISFSFFSICWGLIYSGSNRSHTVMRLYTRCLCVEGDARSLSGRVYSSARRARAVDLLWQGKS